jgi:4'-phosphopantetheinyl transferase
MRRTRLYCHLEPLSVAPGIVDESKSGDRLSLWWVRLDGPSSVLRELTESLSAEERGRADRLERELERDRFLAARGWLRRLLARELGCAPAEVTIVADEGGKPRVADAPLRFSAARSEGLALYATSWHTEVGVDVEAIRTPVDVEGIAARFFSPGERRALEMLPAERRVTAAFHCWTRKEAFVKGIGAGVSFPLAGVDVWAGDGRPVTVSGWSIQQVDVAAGFAAAVAGADLGDWVPALPRRLDRGSPL